MLSMSTGCITEMIFRVVITIYEKEARRFQKIENKKLRKLCVVFFSEVKPPL